MRWLSLMTTRDVFFRFSIVCRGPSVLGHRDPAREMVRPALPARSFSWLLPPFLRPHTCVTDRRIRMMQEVLVPRVVG